MSVSDQTERRMIDARQDFEDVSKLTKAEMARFDKEKVDDVKKAIEDYADGMAARQREVRRFTCATWFELVADTFARRSSPCGRSIMICSLTSLQPTLSPVVYHRPPQQISFPPCTIYFSLNAC